MKRRNEGQLVFLSLHSRILCTLADLTPLLLAEIRHCWGREASCSPERESGSFTAAKRSLLEYHLRRLQRARGHSEHLILIKWIRTPGHLWKHLGLCLFERRNFFFNLRIIVLCFAKKGSITLEVSLLLEQSQVAWINNLRSGPFLLWPSWEM